MIVLDTHVLLWWASGEHTRLSAAAARAIASEQEGGRILVSSISAWELAMLVERGRVALSIDTEQWLALAANVESLQFVPVDNDIAVKSVNLPGEFHKDPADRIVVATARRFAAPLVTADEKILAYPHLRTIW
ncbi:MAG TPA: type II toxin-antitoxin system VapC family toxin [Pseudomonadota bacterium]|nr:type II toxin-antitoxin system VapC family toxin [Pseudomonadota bacterium]